MGEPARRHFVTRGVGRTIVIGMDIIDDRTGLEALDVVECLRLLGTQYIGRIGLVHDGQAYVLPVNYALDGPDVVFRTAVGSTFHRVVRSREVVFEIDSADPAYHTGWSVLGVGVAHEVVDPVEIERLAHLALRPWSRAHVPGWIRVRFSRLTGRRIVELPGGAH